MNARNKSTLSVLTASAVLVLFAGYSPGALLAHYSFDSNFTDGSGNGNDLTVATGTPTITSTAGEHVFGGGALDLDSTISNAEFLDLATPILFNATDAWSVSFWVRRRAGSDIRQGMVLGDTTNTTDFVWAADNPSQVEGLRFRSSANSNANFDGFPDDGSYHHWVLISDGAGTVSAYRDNVAQTPVSTNGSLNIASVGHAYNATTFSMNGQIDELYIFDEAIASDTVGSLFSANAIPEPAALSLVFLGGLLLGRHRRG